MRPRGIKTFILFILGLGLSHCSTDQIQIFERLPDRVTGIDFNNLIQENDRYNVYRFMNIYTGAGVAAGDINNDGLTDLYFSGNMVTGRLYLNKGNLQFEDITESSGLDNTRWGTGTTMVDINQDGWMDIYVCVSGSEESRERANMLFINNGDNTFHEEAASFGIDDERQTQHGAFFDYDRDGDLDLFLIINPAAYERKVNVVQPRKLQGEGVSTDVLYRNNGNNTFTDVSSEAHILIEGYSLGVGISDINNDGWPDIYISNDFVGNDIMYINNGDGTFSDRASSYLAHTSYAGMGNDLADFNNDGLVDIMVLDMRPEDNLRQKLIISSTGYDRFQLMLEAGYQPQYSRNTLQLNRGGGHFSEIGFMAGVSSTDWSWSALFADYDNDGDKDLFVTNGFLRDLGNLDYIHYQNIYDNPMGDADTKIKNKLADIHALEGANIHDYLYENMGEARFQDRSELWGIDRSGYSSGAVYADLDNDGDLELVVNNTNEPAHVYENMSNETNSKNYLQFDLNGPHGNRNGIGAKIRLSYKGRIQFYEHYVSRGYESSMDHRPHFGLGDVSIVDSLEIYWPDGKYQLFKNVPANQLLPVSYSAAVFRNPEPISAKTPLFQEVSQEQDIVFNHREDPQVDFNIQPILPKMHSQEGPGIAIGDINGDGFEDIYIGGATGSPGKIFTRNEDNTKYEGTIWPMDSVSEDMGTLFFDAESDGDLDLFVVSGGTSFPIGSHYYQDRLYLNDGEGNFSKYTGLPQISSSGSSVVGADFDKDGDIDLFVGGRVVPGEYPLPPTSYLLRNDSEVNGKPKFTDITSQITGLKDIGMVTSALWTDYDNDSWLDLMLVGEFMPIVIFKNTQGQLGQTQIPGLKDTEGWWNSLVAADFDNDGDTDYMAGNLGLNSKYRATKRQPLCIYASDFDKNGRLDPVMCQFVDNKNYLTHTRDDLIKQISAMRARFKTYKEYAEATFEESFLKEELENAYIVRAKSFESSYIKNLGDGNFQLSALPWMAQVAPLYGMIAEDYNGDGFTDVILSGNSYSTEVSTGRYDASLGLVLLGDGKGGWHTMELGESGLMNVGDAKGLAALYQGNSIFIIFANNSGLAQVYYKKQKGHVHSIQPLDSHANITLADGARRKVEFYYGNTYLSHSSRIFVCQNTGAGIDIVNSQGTTKKMKCN